MKPEIGQEVAVEFIGVVTEIKRNSAGESVYTVESDPQSIDTVAWKVKESMIFPLNDEIKKT